MDSYRWRRDHNPGFHPKETPKMSDLTQRIEQERRNVSEPGQETLAAYTPETYQGERPPFFNIARVGVDGSMVRVTMRGATLHDGSGGETAVAVVNLWTLGMIAQAFTDAMKKFRAVNGGSGVSVPTNTPTEKT